MLWFLRGLRKGVVTTRYPAARDAWAAALPSPPRFRGDLLTVDLAGRLVEACPTGALRLEVAELVLDVGACAGCRRCSELGGEGVVESHEFELAAHDRESLVKRVRLGGDR
jgi:hypothetical protein